jgi:hypothetical protein
MAANAATRKPAATKPKETAAQRRARLAADRPTAAVVSVPDAPEVSIGAPRLGVRKVETEERETLFYVSDVAYTIPKRFSYAWALEYAHVGRTQGRTAAVAWAMERALGTVGTQVLFGSDVADEDCERMVTFVLGRIEGLPDPK